MTETRMESFDALVEKGRKIDQFVKPKEYGRAFPLGVAWLVRERNGTLEFVLRRRVEFLALYSKPQTIFLALMVEPYSDASFEVIARCALDILHQQYGKQEPRLPGAVLQSLRLWWKKWVERRNAEGS